jgi:hypothetical protein
MEGDAGVADTFARLGLDVRSVPLAPGYDGARQLWSLYDVPANIALRPGALGFGMGVPLMMNSPKFQAWFGRWGLGRRDDRFPFVALARLELTVDDGPESGERLYGRIRDLLESMADASIEGFYVRVHLGERNKLVGHCVGVEFVLEPDPGAARIVVYDPWARRDEPPSLKTRELIRGPLWRVASCPRCARAMLWDPSKRPFPFRFAPRVAPQTVGDGFCQTWLYVLYELRAEAGNAEAALELASASEPAAMRRRLVDFLRRAVRSDFATEFWERRTLRRRDGGEASGADFLRWLRWAAELPGFGAGYVAAAPIFERSKR